MIVALVLFVVAAVLALLPGVVAGPLSWLVIAYVVFRAYPAIRADLRGLRSGAVGASVPLPSRRARRGGHL